VAIWINNLLLAAANFSGFFFLSYATEIWVKRDGNWLQQLYQETALDPR
jgi:hypothetical protein